MLIFHAVFHLVHNAETHIEEFPKNKARTEIKLKRKYVVWFLEV